MAKGKATMRENVRDVAIIMGGLLLAFAFFSFLCCVVLGTPILAVFEIFVQMGPG